MQLLWFNAQNVNAQRQDFFQIHEHARPIKTLRLNDGIDEGRALVEFGVFRL